MSSRPASVATDLSHGGLLKAVSHSCTCLQLVVESRHCGDSEVTSDYIQNPTLSNFTV